jgi:hypothetical protein
MLTLIPLLTVTFPILWFASEFQDRRWLRIGAGVASILMSFLIAFAVGTMEHLNANAWYGGASKNLIDAAVEELEEGATDRLLQELKVLQEQFHPTYENRARYDKLIEEFLSRLGKQWKHAV